MSRITTPLLILFLGLAGTQLAAQKLQIVQQYFDNYAAMLNTLSDVEGESVDDRRLFKVRLLKEYFDPEKSVICNHLPNEGSRDLLAEEYLENLLVDYTRSIEHSIEVKEIIDMNFEEAIFRIKHTISRPEETSSDLKVVMQIHNFNKSSLYGTIHSISFYDSTDIVQDLNVHDANSNTEDMDSISWNSELNTKDLQAQSRSLEAKKQREEEKNENQYAQLPAPIQDLLENKMVEVEGGIFNMGCTFEHEDDCYLVETPAHRVKLDDFFIGKYEVTVEEYLAFAEATNSHWPVWMETSRKHHIELRNWLRERHIDFGYKSQAVDLPVVGISWEDAQAFCKWLNEQTGKAYRLPTEAEWEYAARGGQKAKSTKYAGSNSIDKVANYQKEGLFGFFRKTKAREVGHYDPNELGLYDMSGNVSEYCQDWYSGSYYEHSPRSNPQGPTNEVALEENLAEHRIARGGSFFSRARDCRVSKREPVRKVSRTIFQRDSNGASYIGPLLDNGFRLCLSGFE